MGAPPPGAMAPGPIVYKRQYSLALLVVLIIVCWPAAIIYYVTCDEVPVQEYYPVAGYVPVYPQTGYAGAPFPAQPGVPSPYVAVPACPRCGRPTTWIPQYSRYYCYSDQKYV